MRAYLSLLKHNRNYRYLWLGSIITQLGDWFNLLASAELITHLTDSGVAVSYLFLVRFGPLFLFSPIAGIFADRYDRRVIMVATDLLRAIIVLCFLFIRSSEQLWLLYVLTIMQFALSALFTPARSAMLSNIVARNELVTANALDSLTWSTMLALGAFVGGVVAAVFGANVAFIVDALTYVVSALILVQITIPKSQLLSKVSHNNWFEFVEGLRYLYQTPFILGLALVKGSGSLVWGAINVLEVNFAEHVFPLDAQIPYIEDGGTATLGLIYVVSGIGTGLGPLLVRHWLGDAPKRLLLGILMGFVLMVSGIFGLGMVQLLSLFLFFVFVRTVGTGLIWVFSAALLQIAAPNRVRGRVFAFEFAFLTLTQSLSTLWAGFAQDQVGLTASTVTFNMGILGAGCMLVWIIFLLYFWQRPSLLNSRKFA